MMSYTGGDRWMVLQWLNAGTKARYNGGRNGRTEAQYNKFVLGHEGRGFRGSITGRGWFGQASFQEMQNAAANIDKMIDEIVAGVLF